MYAVDKDEKQGAGKSAPPVRPMNGATAGGDSGLIDLKKLADGEIATSQNGLRAIQDEEASAILASTSSASLSQIVLPIPGREVAPVDAAETPSRAPVQPKKSRAGLAVAIVLVLGAGAAAAFVLLKRSEKKNQNQVAANDVGSAPEGATMRPADTAPLVTPTDTTGSSDTAAMEAEAKAKADAEALALAEAAKTAGKTDREERKDRTGREESKSSAKTETSAKTEVAAKTETKTKTVVTAPEPEDKTGATAKTIPANDTQKEIEKLLKTEQVVEDDGPKKTRLEAAEIKTGMNKVRGAVQSCADASDATGVVKVSVTIASSGSPTAAKVTGEFASHAIASCVKEALMKASFPSWTGAATTVSYAFSVD